MTFQQWLSDHGMDSDEPFTRQERELAEAAWNAARQDMQSNTQTLTCVFCGHQYPPGTPPSNHELLVEHIKTCDKHPLYAVLRVLANLTDVMANGEVDLENASIPLRDAWFRARAIVGSNV